MPSAQSVDIRGTDTCPAPGSDQFFRRRRSSKQISEILGIKQHYRPHLFQLLKQWRRGRSAMAGLLPTHFGTLQCPHHQHHKPDQATILVQQLLPDTKTNQRNSISLNLHLWTPTSLTIINNAPSARSLVIMLRPTPRSAKPSIISTTGFNLACIMSLIVDKCLTDGKTETKTSSLPNRSTKDREYRKPIKRASRYVQSGSISMQGQKGVATIWSREIDYWMFWIWTCNGDSSWLAPLMRIARIAL